MNNLARKLVWPLISLSLAVYILCSIAFDDVIVSSGLKTTLWQRVPIFGAHLSPKSYIRIGSKYFTGVEGSLPFYTPVRGSDLIAFVTVGKDGRLLHIAKPISQELVMSVPITSYFGVWIGRSSLSTEEYDEAILLPSRTEIMLKHSTSKGARQTFIDLKKGVVLKEIDTQ